jgi:hypothetical protein
VDVKESVSRSRFSLFHRFCIPLMLQIASLSLTQHRRVSVKISDILLSYEKGI